MDGVLVDVSESYRKAIQETVQFFSGEKPESSEIQSLKELGGYNNDWDLTTAFLKKRDKQIPKTKIIEKFQELYWGSGEKRGFIDNENWLLAKEKLLQLRERHCLGIVTGRPKQETFYVLRKFGVESLFDAVVAMEDYPADKGKPDPFPIRVALEKLGVRDAIYVGDSVDDIEAAKRAGLRAVGCISSGIPRERLEKLLLAKGAEKVLDDINGISELAFESPTKT